jgi:hypothetical protein
MEEKKVRMNGRERRKKYEEWKEERTYISAEWYVRSAFHKAQATVPEGNAEVEEVAGSYATAPAACCSDYTPNTCVEEVACGARRSAANR